MSGASGRIPAAGADGTARLIRGGATGRRGDVQEYASALRPQRLPLPP
jgi:hypothetical protein